MSANTSVHWDLLSKPSGSSAVVSHDPPQQSILKIVQADPHPPP